MCFYDVESLDCATYAKPKARHPHRCKECGDTIPAGSVYLKVTGVFQGSGFTHKECRRCCYDRKRIRDQEIADGCWGIQADPGFGGLVDGLTECDMEQTPVDMVPADFRV